MDLTVILCVLNEYERLPVALADLITCVSGRKESCEIIVIDNGSFDGTREFLVQLQEPGVRVELNDHDLGKGGSIRRGIGT